MSRSVDAGVIHYRVAPSTAMDSTCGVCGNMSTGVHDLSSYAVSPGPVEELVSASKSRACVRRIHGRRRSFCADLSQNIYERGVHPWSRGIGDDDVGHRQRSPIRRFQESLRAFGRVQFRQVDA